MNENEMLNTGMTALFAAGTTIYLLLNPRKAEHF